MATSYKATEPFAFWLVRNFLLADDTEEERPMSDREFCLHLGITALALVVFGVIIRFC
jgi:hypothetical protein